MMIRRLNPKTDKHHFVESWLWESQAALWFKTADKVFGPPTFEDFLKASAEDDRATFGIFEHELIGLIILTLRAKGLFEVDLMAKPRCSPVTILEGAISLRDAIFEDLGAQALYVWLSKKNFPTKRLCAILGFYETGLTLIRGTYRNRVIEWVNLSLSREVWESQTVKAA